MYIKTNSEALCCPQTMHAMEFHREGPHFTLFLARSCSGVLNLLQALSALLFLVYPVESNFFSGESI